MATIEFTKLTEVDSIDWLIKTCLAEQENAYKVLEDPRLWSVGKYGLDFIEVYDVINATRVCVARFVYINFELECCQPEVFGLIVYPPYQNKGYSKVIIKWLKKYTNITTLQTRNPYLAKVLIDNGFKIIDTTIGEYSNLEESIYKLT